MPNVIEVISMVMPDFYNLVQEGGDIHCDACCGNWVRMQKPCANHTLTPSSFPTVDEKRSVWYYWIERRALDHLTDWNKTSFRNKFPRVSAAYQNWLDAENAVTKAVEEECQDV